MSTEPKSPKKSSSVRHTRAIQPDRSKKLLREPLAEEPQKLLEEAVSPIVDSQVALSQTLELRQRNLTLIEKTKQLVCQTDHGRTTSRSETAARLPGKSLFCAC